MKSITNRTSKHSRPLYKKALFWCLLAGGGSAIAALAATTMPSTNPTPMASTAPDNRPPALIKAMAALATQKSTASTQPNEQAQNNQYQRNQNGQRGRRGRRGGQNGNFTYTGNGDSTEPSDSDLVQIPPTGPIPVMYQITGLKDIFVRGAPISGAGNNNQGNNGPRGPAPLVFNGATNTDGTLLAYIEDTGTGEIRMFKVGDTVADRGTITALDLNTITLKNGTDSYTVTMGNTLSGESAFNALYLSQPTATPSASSSTPAAIPSGDDVVARLQRRRLMELNGGATPGPSTRQ